MPPGSRALRLAAALYLVSTFASGIALFVLRGSPCVGMGCVGGLIVVILGIVYAATALSLFVAARRDTRLRAAIGGAFVGAWVAGALLAFADPGEPGWQVLSMFLGAFGALLDPAMVVWWSVVVVLGAVIAATRWRPRESAP